MSDSHNDVQISFDGPVATVEICKPPHNFFTIPLIRQLADAFEDLEADRRCHAIVLAAQGSSFCAGADFSNRDATPPQRSPRALNPIYDEAIRMFACAKPVVAAVQGPAIGGGLGLALVADFRVSCPEAKFSANFNRLGFHPGFGLSVTLPRLVGVQQAAMLFYTGRRIGGEAAAAMGLVDVLVAQEQVRVEAAKLAREIAISAPLAVQSTRATLRQGLVEQIRLAVARESTEQNAQFKTADFKEGVVAMAARREPQFKGE
ncbi:MAG: enoyl-CoA hydratase [Burkholderiales bacterium RIFCSPHIGHO2_12_FULL_69_20]|nr:MAG: enoyl-CoA hydratase [Burkholderiales bacterium RIFCSPHIGHO2_12_FULL_69_20]